MNGDKLSPSLFLTHPTGQFLYVVIGVSVAKSFFDAMEKILTVDKKRDSLVGRFNHRNFLIG